MADSAIVHYSGNWISHQGAAVSGAKLYVYNEDTLDLASIFSDRDLVTPLANPVTADSGGLMPFAYIGTQAYKVILTTSAGVTIDEEDDLPGALDTSTFAAATFAKPDTDCSADTSDTTLTTSNLGTVRNGNCTSATFTYTLPSAVTASNGRGYIIRHIGTANQIKIATVSSQTITHPSTGVTTTQFVLIGYGESVTIVSDGAGWHITAYVPPLMRPNTPGIIQIADRVSSAPVAPTPGARYIVSGAYSTFEQEDIIEYDGTSYIEFTPPTDCGWVAYVQDEDAFYAFVGSAWVAEAATQSDMETATSVARYVTPGRQHFHPGHPKCWLVATVTTGTPTLQTSYNITGIADTATGRLGVTIATDFSTANWCCLATCENNVAGSSSICACVNKAVGSVEIASLSDAASLQDPISWSMMGLGDHA